MYSALNKGFARASGEVMGWLSATDLLHPGGLFVVGSVFASLASVEWITGLPIGFTEDGMATSVGPPPRWTRGRFLLGANRYIQQESTFWRRGLWQRAGAAMSTERELFSDFELWLRFFRHAPLHPVRGLVGGFRHHGDSRWLVDPAQARRITEAMLAAELPHVRSPLLRLAARAGLFARHGAAGCWLWDRLVSRPLYSLPGPDLPALVWHDGRGWRLGR
jgi:hypothetical protein